MKNFLTIILSGIMLMALGGCGNTTDKQIKSTPEPPPEVSQIPKTDSAAVVIYFSATGTTKALAQTIAGSADMDIYEIVPKIPYTSADLNYNSDCRANAEQQDDSARPEFEPIDLNLDDYSTIFLGYPIWWGTMPKIINTFLETYDLSDKTIMPFCTSGGSGIETSVSAIKGVCPNADVKDGFRGSSSTDASQLNKWFSEIGYKK